MMDDSVTWKQVGLGVAYLRLDKLDQALEYLTQAVKRDPTNAVAEYFLGQVRREQSRDVPFWFEMNDNVPFRLAAYDQNQLVEADREDRAQTPGKAVLPPFRNPTFDKQAERHFRRAIGLAPKCDLDRTINVVQPAIQFANQWPLNRPTVRDLLISLGEANYLEKSQNEIGERLTIDD
jgi:tetratricopeptide (TPR) repeat protein